MARAKRRRRGLTSVAKGPFDGICDRCDRPIGDFRFATKRHGKWIHKGCAPGGDDV